MYKKPRFISPSALGTWLYKETDYYLKYLSEHRPPRIPQSEAMAVGSAFDAYIKAYIHAKLYGKGHPDSSKFDFDTLFSRQVEEHNRDFALNAGAHCFRVYKSTGALADLLKLLDVSPVPPQMEFTAVGREEEHGISNTVVADDASIHEHSGLVLLGKPDLIYATLNERKVVHDWKVNGYMSSASPAPGYVHMYGKGPHKDHEPWFEANLEINLNPSIQLSKPDWGRQIATYGWICGAAVGEEIIASVDQLACGGGAVRVAQHRCGITKEFQFDTYYKYMELWDRIQSGHFFKDLPLEASNARCEMLNRQGLAYQGDTVEDTWFQNITRRH